MVENLKKQSTKNKVQIEITGKTKETNESNKKNQLAICKVVLTQLIFLNLLNLDTLRTKLLRCRTWIIKLSISFLTLGVRS